MESGLSKEREVLTTREAAREQTAASLREARAKQERVLKDTEGARRKAENLRRRIATLEARHADVLKDGESC